MLTVRVHHHLSTSSSLYRTYLNHMQVLKAICLLANDGMDDPWIKLSGRLSAFHVSSDNAVVADITIHRNGIHPTHKDVIDVALLSGSQLYRLDELAQLMLGEAE